MHDIQRAKKRCWKKSRSSVRSVCGDRGYDSAAMRAHLERTGQEPKIVIRATRKEREGMKVLRLEVIKTITKNAGSNRTCHLAKAADDGSQYTLQKFRIACPKAIV